MLRRNRNLLMEVKHKIKKIGSVSQKDADLIFSVVES